MGLWPEAPIFPPPVMLVPHGRASRGIAHAAGNAPAAVSTVLGTGNVAFVYAIRPPDAVTLTKAFVYNGATANGNWEVGLYDSERQLLVSTGSVAQSGTDAVQEFDITDVTIEPGLYYLAFAFSSATAAYMVATLTGPLVGIGGSVMLSAFPLPAAFVSAGVTSAIVRCGFSSRSLVA